MKLWGVDMSRNRTFSLGEYGGVVRAVSRSKVRVVLPRDM